jgi:hypothetical protein
MAIEDRLSIFLRDARDWERRATNIPGVFLLKLPNFGPVGTQEQEYT